MADLFSDPVCVLCGVDLSNYPFTRSIGTLEGMRRMHDECALREVMGGIGHLIAHDYWCTQKGDPDAGLTYRQSALLVHHLVEVVGVEAAAERGSITS